MKLWHEWIHRPACNPADAFLCAVLSLFVASCAEDRRESRPLTFQSSQFEIVGVLEIPETAGKHPAIIIVHGDGRGTRSYYRDMRERFVSAGYATFIWDKPGFGGSKGEFSEGKTLIERAHILLEGISTLREHPAIDPDRIGVWGVSQAGYVISLALQQAARLKFMILVGAPGENGVRQTAYFIGQQVLCEGYTSAEAAEADSLAAGVLSARTYGEYVAYGRPLLDHFPIVKDLDFMAGILPEDRWRVRKSNGESYYDPLGPVGRIDMPALVFYGELDKNVDPIQGAEAYRAVFAKAGNAHSRVIVFPKVDHDMVPSETGCMRERNRRNRWEVHPGYLDTMIHWLGEIDRRDASADRR